MSKTILILGGARSGKSTHAEKLAKEIGGDSVLYVATAEAKDEEMKTRIKKHQSDRPNSWSTLESPTKIGEGIQEIWDLHKVILLDCLTLLVSNLLLLGAGEEGEPIDVNKIQEIVLEEIRDFSDTVLKLDTTVIIVSNEVGLGLVPPYELGRVYRDVLGRANQQIASWANEVYFLAAGIPMRMK
ncbi:MAG: bifunctional adenosylcobinamide kinase/adenosylcobinamide-phosphate guanylyltransferase [Chloroflexi bacterium]|jgi:adenosylcobinamide kinase / adenosylcobinamide-phosphate guanylyltransferase|nr:bifunctional adenosylcobinamide kinase/adenosylcobinamide-phosphate guanylyltransferase [Chloroflexota bacterium]MBT3669008.1 bifunctional adenosylcobinamide kinase/adenosylcobinamide-phosphate guanylyltransferase [Chloroflexota bacterium]MBT4003609.1 bifunctional adenosylcobinamide kinase/adenosylcobinamide-phosphate guanylyltransferase [Chloroflexota bacterium]MBT4304979.1 bifunctional adenosylcobinamide kinase/adenosylcobinamide-phosphate guanylyltransferase [Chloroflexota bacterium]MBT45